MTITEPQKLLHLLIRDIYDTVIRPESWPETLARIANYVGAQGAFLLDIEAELDQRRVIAKHYTSNYDANAVRHYFEAHNQRELADQDVLTSFVGPGDEIALIPDTILHAQEGIKNNAWREAGEGLRWRAASILNKDCHDRDRLALQFSGDPSQPREWHLSRAADLLPHLAKALDLGRSIAEARSTQRGITETLQRLLIGVAIVDGRGRLKFCNSEFERHLEAAGSVRLDRSGQLRVTIEGEAARIDQIFGGLWAHGRFGCRPRKEAITSSAREIKHLMVEVMPMNNVPEMNHSDINGHIIYSIDTGRGFSVNQERLKKLFGLTNAEAEVMTYLARGLTNEQISEARETSVLTTRTQLKSIFSKLDASNRVQAVRVAANVCNAFVAENSA